MAPIGIVAMLSQTHGEYWLAGAVSAITNQQIRIEGYTDDVPVTTSRYSSNWELSLDRASNIMRIFLEKYDFSPVNISIAGYGQYRPLASNDTETGRKRNRRVDIVLLEERSGKSLL